MQFAKLLVLGVAYVTPCFDHVFRPRQHDRYARRRVVVAMAHARAIKYEAIVEQGAILILVRFHTGQQAVEFLHVPQADL